jgi:hypothetical protein
MKIGATIVLVLVIAWVGLWVSSTGLLVYSAATKVPTTRECRYLVGVSVVTRYVVLAERCELISRLRG